MPFAAGGADRHRRAADRAEALGATRPAVLHRERRRRRRQHRHGAGRARRRPTATRSCCRHRASRSTRASTPRCRSTWRRTSSRSPGRRLAELLAGQPGLSGEDDEGPDRADQDRTRANTASARPALGTTPSLSIELFKLTISSSISSTVPFAGGGPMTQSLLGGHVPIVVRRASATRVAADQGRQDPRARRSPTRSGWRRCPTSRRSTKPGIKDQEAETITGVFVPAGTPKEIVDLLQQEIATIVKSAGHQGEAAGARLRAGRQHAGRVRGLRQGRHRQMEAGHRRRKCRERMPNDLRLQRPRPPG